MAQSISWAPVRPGTVFGMAIPICMPIPSWPTGPASRWAHIYALEFGYTIGTRSAPELRISRGFVKVLLTGLPIYSHIVPVIIPLAKVLVRQGHDVAVVTGASLATEVSRHGLDCLPVPGIGSHA